MSKTLDRAFGPPLESALTALAPGPATAPDADVEARAEPVACFHCGEPCRDASFTRDNKAFCCQGCLVVHDLLTESGLEEFYTLGRHPGARVRGQARRDQWACLDDPALQQRLLDFTDGKLSRVTFHIPAIHCIACVWLLENLFRLHPGIGRSQVSFPRREVAIHFSPREIALSELVALLASLGYEPHLTLGELEKQQQDPGRRRRWLQVGIAGFAFGNIMLFSIPAYLGLDSINGPFFRAVFGYLSLLLAAPVVFYSASDYWRSALLSLRQRRLTLDVPIVLGLAALYAQSAFEIASDRGEGYLDSLAGLVFFLLCGRVFQQKTHERMVFDRDYKCFFPLSVMRKTAAGEESVAISHLRIGDRLALRHGELIPADAKLLCGPACIDYSFVTGESEPVAKQAGDYLYAGGQQIGGGIELEIVKPVSQSYLTSLWNDEAFQKSRDNTFNTLTNRYSRRFTRVVIAIALGAASFWVLSGDTARAIKAFTSVLIVACPCALALTAPFTLGTAQRLLARLQVFLRNALVLERMAQVDTVVFDKTGTLTASQGNEVTFHSIPCRRRRKENQSPHWGRPGSQRTGRRLLPLLLGRRGLGRGGPFSLQPPSVRWQALMSGQEAVLSPRTNGPNPPSLSLTPPFMGVAEGGSEEGNRFNGFPPLARPGHAETVETVGLSASPPCPPMNGGVNEKTQAAGPVPAQCETQRLLTSSPTDIKLSSAEASWVHALARHSTHPHSLRIAQSLANSHPPESVQSFAEIPGCGISGQVRGHELRLGSKAWLQACGVAVPELALPPGSVVGLALDGEFRGAFVLANALRPATGQLLQRLSSEYEIALLSGDNERERQRFQSLFSPKAHLRFNQSPQDKLGFIRDLQRCGKTVMMVGDGLNDSGALKQSDVGVAVVEKVGAFSPASDVILEAARVPRLFEVLCLARSATRIVRWGFVLSGLYNLVGVSIAAAGILSPLICAILMPLSSVSVVLFACGATTRAASKLGLTPANHATRNPQPGHTQPFSTNPSLS